MDREVTEAMAQAARSFVRMDQLHAAAGEKIAGWTGAEAALVTAGAAASLTLAAAACLAGDDFARMDRLPDTRGMPNEIIIPHRTAMVTIMPCGQRARNWSKSVWPSALAIRSHGRSNQRSATAPWPWPSRSAFPLLCIKSSQSRHRHRLPVIVDASAALPPKSNLRAFIEAGADLVAFSGGKACAVRKRRASCAAGAT